MRASSIVFLALAVVAEVARELCFKHGSHAETRRGFLADIFTRPIILLGLLFSVIEMAVWLAVLQHEPLVLAFPVLSLCYCGTVLAGRWILNERVSLTRWGGVGLITLGVAVIGSTGVSV